jgi:hypothetical protein
LSNDLLTGSARKTKATDTLGGLFCLPGEAGKPGHLKEDGVTPTEGKTIRLARASLANGGV